jgi:hypothetical protein
MNPLPRHGVRPEIARREHYWFHTSMNAMQEHSRPVVVTVSVDRMTATLSHHTQGVAAYSFSSVESVVKPGARRAAWMRPSMSSSDAPLVSGKNSHTAKNCRTTTSRNTTKGPSFE